MVQLNLPAYHCKLVQEQEKTLIFDSFRKKYVVLTPEEWVRQHFLHWLVGSKGYPLGLIAVETSLKYNRLNKRADAIIYNKAGKPQMIVECKAPEVKITQDAFDQIARYNFGFGVKFLAVTNGLQHYCCRMQEGEDGWQFLEEFPDFQQLNVL
jgi:predicted type IV restriction endonuclease